MILGMSHSQSTEGDLNSKMLLVNGGFTQVEVAQGAKADISLSTVKSLSILFPWKGMGHGFLLLR